MLQISLIFRDFNGNRSQQKRIELVRFKLYVVPKRSLTGGQRRTRGDAGLGIIQARWVPHSRGSTDGCRSPAHLRDYKEKVRAQCP